MAKHPFLSPEWTSEARRLRAEHRTGEAPPVSIRMNLVVIEVPFGEGRLDAHLDTSDGQIGLDTGHVEDPEVSVTLDYETAKAFLVDGDSQAAMQAFLAGRVRVEGDISKLLALQATPIDGHAELSEAIRAITA